MQGRLLFKGNALGERKFGMRTVVVEYGRRGNVLRKYMKR